ncbi:hypothetical protein [Sporosarcina sp. A2]|uniref:hypothetical protein n=1 Tax=Sporosarcina sp. A2 TaxID=3393449 RepID=UPI003D793845
MTKTRKQRRLEARENKTLFVPNYGFAGALKSFKEYYGVGYERFNTKYVTIREAK